MNKSIQCLLLALLMMASHLYGQEESKGSFTVSINQDVFFGFYPAVFGSYELGDNLNLSYYGIFWTTPSFGSGGGSGLWTEFGAGVSFDAGPLTIAPQVGVLSGKLLSNGANGIFFDGLVPNLTIDLNDDLFEGQIYAGYYASIMPGEVDNGSGEMVDVSSTNDFLHYWANFGIAPAEVISFGLHLEHLYFSPSNIIEADFTPDTEPAAANLYQWFGPYVQLNHPDGHGLRFLAGPQLVEGGGGSFYKLTASFGF
ncbi:MAG: DUF6733 family protein [Bacteroidota bacterium]